MDQNSGQNNDCIHINVLWNIGAVHGELMLNFESCK